MKTNSIKENEIQKNWFVVDANGKNLGRLASNIAQVLRGKRKPDFTPHMDMGDCVVVINAEKVSVTGNNKENQKTYWSHSGYPGALSLTTMRKMRKTFPERIIQNAVQGMLPHNRLGRKILKSLKVYSGSDHPHEAQQPQQLEF